ncbi:hypothetical protein ACFXG4_17175 [Nocardia sp. NPDC059246]|uniref:hypothetical protein n=1 Tax=unclassified Nocardia TaxID=2637762 RepID=UPI0036B82504
MDVAIKIARLITPLSAGLYAGSLLTLLVIELSLRDFGGSIYTQVEQINLIGIPARAAATGPGRAAAAH